MGITVQGLFTVWMAFKSHPDSSKHFIINYYYTKQDVDSMPLPLTVFGLVVPLTFDLILPKIAEPPIDIQINAN